LTTVLWTPVTSAQTVSEGADHWQPFNVTTNPTGKGCSNCHGASPSGARANAAGSSTTAATGAGIIAAAVANNAETGMGSISLTSTQRQSLSLYIESVVNTTPLAVAVNFNTAKTQSLTNKVVMDTGATLLNVLETDPADVPGKGSVSYDDDASPAFTYTPTTNQCGADTFKYRARRSSTGLVTASRTVNITIAGPGPIDITNASNTKNGTYDTFLSYTITASPNPISYSHSGTLPPGITRSGATFSGTPTAVGTWNVTMSASNCEDTDSETLTFNIAKANQIVTIPAQGTVLYRPGTTYTITGTSSTSGLSSFTYASSTPAVCTISSGATINKLAAGVCSVTATQAGNANYNADTSAVRNITISKASQSIDFPTQVPGTRAFSTTPYTITNLATATSGLAVTYTSDTPGVCTVSGTSVTMVSAGTCTLRANQDGDTNWDAAIDTTESVTITATVPGAPTGVGASAGDAQASVTFTPPVNNGGAAITSYTATCSASGQTTRTGSAASSPIMVSSLVNGVTYSCNVYATNSAGNGSTSGSANVTPSATPVAPSFTSTAAATFTIGSSGTFNVTASGVPVPTFSHIGGSMPSGMSLSSGGVLSGTPALGTTSGNRSLTFRATNSAGTADQVFTLTINKASQTISFTNPGAQSFSANPIPLTVSSSSGLAVTLTVDPSATSVCSVAGASVTMLSVGQCVINADQPGDANYEPAKSVQRTFAINQGTQTITFLEQNPATRPFLPSTFPLSPAATASSGLPVTHTSTTPAVCTVADTTVTVLEVGTCTIEASQAGNANYQQAVEVSQTLTIVPADQVITFASTQPAQNYSLNGTFALAPLGASSSGLVVTYSSAQPDICTITDTTITMAAVGTCRIAADQPGDTHFNAAPQVVRTIVINAVVPGAPTIGIATPGNGQAAIEFMPPSSDGGAAITNYTATCNPGAITGSGAASPVSVTGLTNGVAYTCSVTATNSAGTGAASATVNVTPASSSGAALWTNTCSGCHGAAPAGARFNAAGSTATVLAYVRTNQPSMAATPAVQALSTSDLEALAAYIEQQVPVITVTTPVNTQKVISVASHITLGTISFTSVEVVSGPTNGMVSAFTNRNVTYTPNPGFTGTDSFTYRGKRTSPTSLLGDVRTITVTVAASTVSLSVNLTGGGFGSVESAPFGIRCGNVCTEIFVPGTSVTLTATPDAGYAFSNWNGVSCAGGNTGPTCTFTLNSNTSLNAQFRLAAAPRFDVSGDGMSDVVWYHTGVGGLIGMNANGLSLGALYIIDHLPDLNWKVTGLGDLNGDGRYDVVWRNESTGEVYGLLMGGGTVLAEGMIYVEANTQWKIEQVADIDGDGKADLIWKNQSSGDVFIMKMDGLGFTGGQVVYSEPNLNWKIVASGDMNGDGRADLLWRNEATGDVFAMLMDGFTVLSGGVIYNEPNLNWKIIGLADFNLDARADVLWQNTATGDVFQMQMDGTVSIGGQVIYNEPNTQWKIVALGDYNGDGLADILWQNTTTGHVYMMLMAGFSILSADFVYTEPDTQWRIVGP
jgi:mono/diheme cytochrome c family protein